MRSIAVFAAVMAALIFHSPGAFAASASHSYCARWARAQLDPYDRNVKRASISASARLAVAQQLRRLQAQCEAAQHQ